MSYILDTNRTSQNNVENVKIVYKGVFGYWDIIFKVENSVSWQKIVYKSTLNIGTLSCKIVLKSTTKLFKRALLDIGKLFPSYKIGLKYAKIIEKPSLTHWTLIVTKRIVQNNEKKSKSVYKVIFGILQNNV